MTNNRALIEAKKRYYARNKDKIKAKARIYQKERYKTQSDVIKDKNLNRYHYKQYLKIMLEDEPPKEPENAVNTSNIAQWS